MTEKRCTVCNEPKPLTEYHRDSSAKDGRAWRCKACEAVKNRAYREPRRGEDGARSRAYHAANREERNAISRAYYEDHKQERAAYARAYREANREEVAARRRAYHEDHKELAAARHRAYSQTPNGRAVKRAGKMRRRLRPGGQELTADMIQEVRAASGGICPYCGEPFEDGHVDHIIPASRGGTNDRENLVYCCAHCNLSKQDKALEDWQAHATEDTQEQ